MFKIDFGPYRCPPVSIRLPCADEIAKLRERREELRTPESRLILCPDGKKRLITFEKQYWDMWDWILDRGFCSYNLLSLALEYTADPDTYFYGVPRSTEVYFRLQLLDGIKMIAVGQHQELGHYANCNFNAKCDLQAGFAETV